MLVSFVLRLRSEDLERGLLTGRIEHVASGQQHAFTDLSQVADFCLSSAREDLPGSGPVTAGTDNGMEMP